MRPARRSAIAAAWRRAASRLLACAVLAAPGGGHAQAALALALGLDSVDRYRGMGTADVGPVLRASAMVDAPAGAYAGIAGLWRTRDAGLASADALLGWSGRLAALPALDTLAPEWGWDAALHRRHDDGDGRRDFNEAMLGLLAPGLALRAWYAPHYFGGYAHTVYTELDGSRALDDRWHAFAHLGWLHYGPAEAGEARTPDRVDTRVGIGATLSNWELRLARDAVLAGHGRGDLDARRRSPAWILGASVAF